MAPVLSQEEKIKRGAEDSGRYFRYMAEYVGFSEKDARAVRESALIIEKYIPDIVGKFYSQLLRYPPTRKYFIRSDGSVDQDYLQLRMHHLTNFWRRTASGIYDDDYARYVDYVGRSHTSHGADPHIYIHERYVIGQVGFVQHAISEAISKELHEIDPDWENRALLAWTKLMMVILEMLARAYGTERDPDTYAPRGEVNPEAVFDLAVQAYEMGLGMRQPSEAVEVQVGPVAELPEGERKIVQVEDFSIGIFHHRGAWIALRNSCLHRGGPVCTGELDGDTLICPWHGYRYNVLDGRLLADPSAALEKYEVEIRDDQVYLRVPLVEKEVVNLEITDGQPGEATSRDLQENEFNTADVPPGKTALVYVDDEPVGVFNIDGSYYAIENDCTHAGGPLNEGSLEGAHITCPWHGSVFDVTTGKVLRGPATQVVKTYRVQLDGGIGRVEEG